VLSCKHFIGLVSALSVTNACKKTSDEKTSSNTGSICSAAGVSSIEELRISSLKIDLPDAIEARKASTKARLVANKKIGRCLQDRL
jgi:hypothetical protein